MNFQSNMINWFAILGMVFLFPSCGDFIYDKDNGEDVVITEGSFSMVNASAYTTWVYINLETLEAVAVEEYSGNNEITVPEEWHFALHRFDCKTNGGAVMETAYSSLEELLDSGNIPDGEFTEDVITDDVIAYDMSGMMEGIIIYAESDYNTELSKWMNVDLSVMPPIYTASNKVYLIRMKDGSLAAVRFTDFIGPSEVKGYVSFEFIYPFSR